MKHLHYLRKWINCLPAIIMVMVVPLISFSQHRWNHQNELSSRLREAAPDTGRVHLLLKLGQYYLPPEHSLYQGSIAITNPDSASWFAEQALQLSQALRYERGKNEALLIKGDALIRTNQIGDVLAILKSLHDSTRFRLLVTLGQHYLFHTPRSDKNMDSALLFLQQANNTIPDIPSALWKQERIRIKAMCAFITDGVQNCKVLYKELISEMRISRNEENEANAWHELAMLIPSRDTMGITRLNCLENMVSIYHKAGDLEKEIGVLQSIADMHMVHGKLALAETELLNVLEQYKAINYPSLQWTYNLLASVNSKKGDYTKGISYVLKAIESMEANRDYRPAHIFYSHLGHMYMELGQPEKSVEWYSKLFTTRDFTDRGNMYTFRDAGLLARQLIKLKKEKEALAFILDIEARNKPVGPLAEASLLSSLAYCSYVLNLHQQADEYYSKLVKLTGQLNKNNEVTTDVNYELGQYFLAKKQYATAATYLQKALDASEGINTLAVTKDIYLMLYKADSAQGNYFSAMQLLMK
ncbi:MAG TPA: hypothetical protein VHL77_01465, partial [Ferruginibacter sp.]|nr:hypothetical protein [Ferruginibacter sp.]